MYVVSPPVGLFSVTTSFASLYVYVVMLSSGSVRLVSRPARS